MNIRTTIVMTHDGNLVQVPNALVYKSTLRNFTANPKRRENFVVGIGYDDPMDAAQEIARRVLADHPAVLPEPEPWVLADGFGLAPLQGWAESLQPEGACWLVVNSSLTWFARRKMRAPSAPETE